MLEAINVMRNYYITFLFLHFPLSHTLSYTIVPILYFSPPHTPPSVPTCHFQASFSHFLTSHDYYYSCYKPHDLTEFLQTWGGRQQLTTYSRHPLSCLSSCSHTLFYFFINILSKFLFLLLGPPFCQITWEEFNVPLPLYQLNS